MENSRSCRWPAATVSITNAAGPMAWACSDKRKILRLRTPVLVNTARWPRMDPLPGDGDPIMRQFFLFSLVVAALATVAQTGCSKKQKPPLEAAAVPAAMAPGGV